MQDYFLYRDLWGKIEKKPVWKLLADMTPQKIVSLIDFRL